MFQVEVLAAATIALITFAKLDRRFDCFQIDLRNVGLALHCNKFCKSVCEDSHVLSSSAVVFHFSGHHFYIKRFDHFHGNSGSDCPCCDVTIVWMGDENQYHPKFATWTLEDTTSGGRRVPGYTGPEPQAIFQRNLTTTDVYSEGFY